MDLGQIKIIFCFFGLESLTGLPSLIYFFLFLQMSIVVVISVVTWIIGGNPSYATHHKASVGVKNVEYYSVCLMCGTILVEALMRHKRFHKVNRFISDIERASVHLSAILQEFRKDFLTKLTIFMITLVTTECSYYLSNPSNEKLKEMILLNFYMFFFKHIREFHFIFYINVAVTYLKIIQAELSILADDSHVSYLMKNKKFRRNFNRNLRLEFETYLKLRIIINNCVKLVHWSITVIILQNVLQLTVEFYWIAFGYMNNTFNEDTFMHLKIWPLIPCLLPKIFLPLYMWESCETIYLLESDIFHKLQKFNVDSSTSAVVIDSYTVRHF